jgi:hypothetical protein
MPRSSRRNPEPDVVDHGSDDDGNVDGKRAINQHLVSSLSLGLIDLLVAVVVHGPWASPRVIFFCLA